MSRRIIAAALLAVAFAGRLAYGLSQPFWSEDERQVYLIGLRSFARGEWPYFGADVVWTGGQLPGALQGLLIRWPLTIWAAPESPIVLLNLLSFGALALLAWYIRRRLPDLPPWLVWATLLTMPWTLGFSTHVVNTSYVLTGGVLFFVGFLEGTAAFRIGAMPLALAWALMGAGLGTVVQMHMSWVLLPPYVALAAVSLLLERSEPSARRVTRLLLAAGGFLAGAAITGSVLVPTLTRFGPAAGAPEATVTFHMLGPGTLVTILARVLSFVSFETMRFLGLSTAERLAFLWRMPWAAPAVVFVTLVGLVQAVALAAALFARGDAVWNRIRALLVGTVLLLFVSFFFSVRGPQAHSLYVVLPVAAVYGFTVWSRLERRYAAPAVRRWRALLALTLVCGIVMHTALALDRVGRQSLYVDRPLVATAIASSNDRLLGDRRDSRQEQVDRRLRAADVVDSDAFMQASAATDLRVTAADWRPILGGRVSRFVVSVEHRGSAAAYLDVRYRTIYRDSAGREIESREGIVKQIVEPGTSRRWPDLVDGFVPRGASSASFEVTGAEKCVPSSGAASVSRPD